MYRIQDATVGDETFRLRSAVDEDPIGDQTFGRPIRPANKQAFDLRRHDAGSNRR